MRERTFAGRASPRSAERAQKRSARLQVQGPTSKQRIITVPRPINFTGPRNPKRAFQFSSRHREPPGRFMGLGTRDRDRSCPVPARAHFALVGSGYAHSRLLTLWGSTVGFDCFLTSRNPPNGRQRTIIPPLQHRTDKSSDASAIASCHEMRAPKERRPRPAHARSRYGRRRRR